MFNGQLEMSFGNGRGCHTASRRQRRVGRAQWWFARMRQVVERATDWSTPPAPRPEQTWLPGAHRQVSLAPEANPPADKPVEQQVCE